MSRARRRAAATLAACAALLGGARPARAQASPYLPLDDAAYALVDALVARGALRSLPALERPYTTAQLRAAMTETASMPLGPVSRGWLRALDDAVRRWEVAAADAPAARLGVYALGTAETSGRRELMLADTVGGAYPGAGLRMAYVAGPAVVAGRLQVDNRLKEDPDFRGSKRRSIAGRAEDGYAEARWKYGSIFAGRLARNWGPVPAAGGGLQLGSYAYSWDHVAGRIGTDRLSLTSVVARLEPYAAGADSGSYERHLAMHRLAFRWRDLEIGASEAVVYGGVGRGTELAYVNPLAIYQLAQYNETGDGNVSYALDASWRPGMRGAWSAQLLVDDFQIDRCDPACAEPPSWGMTLAAEGVPLVGEQRLFASYTKVSNLTYRAIDPWERWTTFDVGIGRGFADYDEARAGVELAVLPMAPVRAYLALRRQGEGDYRAPFPAREEMPTLPGFLAGTPIRTWRVGASMGGMALGRAAVAADAGWNATRDAGHVAGRTTSGFEGRVRVTLEVGSVGVRP